MSLGNVRRIPRARLLARLVPAVALLATLGCAAAGLTPYASNQPVARQMLAPEYRVFYDALADYGDWVLIEPHGFVFRPRVAWNYWQPFLDGFWAPTDAWGWVWISSEPFGWATYHYGQWFYDRFQGWVWTPGLDWMPAAVSWSIAGDFVGWTPLQGRGVARTDAGPAQTQFVPIDRLGATDLKSHVVSSAHLGAAAAEIQPLQNPARVEGMVIDRGPPLEMVEKRAGPLVRVRLEDLVPVDLGRRIEGQPLRGPRSTPRGPGPEPDSVAAAGREAIERTQRAAERAASEAQRLSRMQNASPATLPIVRPIFGPRDPAPRERSRRADPAAGRGAPPDSAR